MSQGTLCNLPLHTGDVFPGHAHEHHFTLLGVRELVLCTPYPWTVVHSCADMQQFKGG